MRKLTVLIFILAVITAGCTGQDGPEGVEENPEPSDTGEDTLGTGELQEESVEILSEPDAPETGANSTGSDIPKPADENSGTGEFDAFPVKTTVKLSGEIGQKIGNSYLGISEGEIYHFYPEEIQGVPEYTTIKVKDGLHVLHPEGLFFLENDTATIYSNNTPEEAEFPCRWNPRLRTPNKGGPLFNLYVPYMTANFTDSEYWIDGNRLYVPENGFIFLYSNGETAHVKNGTELEDKGCYLILQTEKEPSEQVVFDRYVIPGNVTLIRYEGETYLPSLFEN